MSYLDTAISDAASGKSQPTRAELASMAAEHVKSLSVRATIDFVEAMNNGLSVVWNNPLGLTAQEVLDALGTDASSIFADHAATIAYLADRAPSILAMVQLPPADATITHHPGGTVTVTFPEEPIVE